MNTDSPDNIALLSQRALKICTLVFSLLTLTACGGGGGGDTSVSGTTLSAGDSGRESDERRRDEADEERDEEESSGGDNAGTSRTGYTVLAANDLGMHCADLDYQIFSILPPFNLVHAQLIQLGQGNTYPRIVGDADVDVTYAAASSPNDPAGAHSINTTSQNLPGIFKTNFWEPGNTPLPDGTPGQGSNWTQGGLA